MGGSWVLRGWRGVGMAALVGLVFAAGCKERTPPGLARWFNPYFTVECTGFHTRLSVGRLSVVFLYQPKNGWCGGGLGEGLSGSTGSGEPGDEVTHVTTGGVTTITLLGHNVVLAADQVVIDGKVFPLAASDLDVAFIVRRDGRVERAGPMGCIEAEEAQPEAFTYQYFSQIRPTIVAGPLTEERSKRLWVRLLAERTWNYHAWRPEEDWVIKQLREPENLRLLIAEYAEDRSPGLKRAIINMADVPEKELEARVKELMAGK